MYCQAPSKKEDWAAHVPKSADTKLARTVRCRAMSHKAAATPCLPVRSERTIIAEGNSIESTRSLDRKRTVFARSEFPAAVNAAHGYIDRAPK